MRPVHLPARTELVHDEARLRVGTMRNESEPVAVGLEALGDRAADAARRAGDERDRNYSTVTVFARLRGWSTFRPLSRAIR